MKFVGSKSRISKQIAPIIQSLIDQNNVVIYYEPFVGGLNMIDKINCKVRVGNDIHKELIALWKKLQEGWIPPKTITEEEYQAVRQNPQNYPDYYVGLVGYASTFGSKWFGGYARGFKDDRVGKNMVINPEQAKTVRMIYDWYLDGVGIRAIQFRLEQAGRLTSMGKSNWHMSNISKILQNSFYCGIITYHKEFTPDFLEQKKIRNFGDIELTKVKGSHEPIVTEEEYERVQKMMASRRKTLTNNTSGKRKEKGAKPSGDVWTQLLICECGHKFNRKIWHKTEDNIQYGYQCYSSIRTGTVASRIKKGLSTEGVCRSPMIPGWKLQMMVKHIFNEYITNTEQVLSLAESMLAKHIDDEEPKTDNTKIIEQKITERDKLNKRLNNLIEMRADGEITREVFKSKKEEIESRLIKIQSEIEELQPQEDIQEDVAHDDKIKVLKYYLEQSVTPNDDADLPEDVIKAFIVKVVVHEDGFDWYLRFSPDDEPPHSLNIDGKRKNSAKVSSLCSPLHRLQSAKRRISNSTVNSVFSSGFEFVHEHTFTLDDAKKCVDTHNPNRGVKGYKDITVKIFI